MVDLQFHCLGSESAKKKLVRIPLVELVNISNDAVWFLLPILDKSKYMFIANIASIYTFISNSFHLVFTCTIVFIHVVPFLKLQQEIKNKIKPLSFNEN